MNRRFTEQDYIYALKMGNGIVRNAAIYMDCSKEGIYAYVKRRPHIQMMMQEWRNEGKYRDVCIEGERCKEIRMDSGEWFVVDAEDFERVCTYNWRRNAGGGHPMIQGKMKGSGNCGTVITLGRFLLNEKVKRVWHRNKNWLDNRKSNLRLTSGAHTFQALFCHHCGGKFERVYKANHKNQFCSTECVIEWQRSDEDYKRSMISNGIKHGGQNLLYTPAMIRRFLEWEGTTCAFPLCSAPAIVNSSLGKTLAEEIDKQVKEMFASGYNKPSLVAKVVEREIERVILEVIRTPEIENQVREAVEEKLKEKMTSEFLSTAMNSLWDKIFEKVR